MDAYVKISIAILIEINILMMLGAIFNIIINYVIVAQCSLLLVQAIILIMQSLEYRKRTINYKEIMKSHKLID